MSKLDLSEICGAFAQACDPDANPPAVIVTKTPDVPGF